MSSQLSSKESPSLTRQVVSITPDFSFLREVEAASGGKVPLCYQCRYFPSETVMRASEAAAGSSALLPSLRGTPVKEKA